VLDEAFEEYYLIWIVVFEWHSRFKAGWLSVEDVDGYSRWSSTTQNFEKILEFIHEDRCQTIHELQTH
jgi:hypothetical protein